MGYAGGRKGVGNGAARLVSVAEPAVALHLLASLHGAPPRGTVLGAQPLPHRALVAALVGALQTAEAEKVAVLAAETAAAVHLSAVGHLALLHAVVFYAQGAGLGGPVAPLDRAPVAAAVLYAEPAELDRSGAALHGAPLAAAVGPAKAETGVPLFAAGSLAQLTPAVHRAEVLEVNGPVAALVRASLATPMRDAEGAAEGSLGAIGHLAALAAAMCDAESAAGVHLQASRVGASLAAAVRAAAIASFRGFRRTGLLRARLHDAAAVVLALSPGASRVGTTGLRADLLVGVVLHARAPRLGALVAALVRAHPDPAMGLA